MELYVVVYKTYDYYEFTDFVGLAATAEVRENLIREFMKKSVYFEKFNVPVIDNDTTPERHKDCAKEERGHILYWKQKVEGM